MRERLRIEPKRTGRKNYKFQTRHGIESKVQFKTDNGIRSNKIQKRTQNKFQNRLNSTRAGSQSPHLRSPYPEQKTAVRDKLGYRSPSASPLSQTKVRKSFVVVQSEKICQCHLLCLCQIPRTRSPLARTLEQKTLSRGKLGYRSPAGTPKTKGTAKVWFDAACCFGDSNSLSVCCHTCVVSDTAHKVAARPHFGATNICARQTKPSPVPREFNFQDQGDQGVCGDLVH